MFDDIRPYRNDEVHAVVQKLINEPEFMASVANFALPKLHAAIPFLAKWLIKFSFQKKLKKLGGIEDIQLEVAKYLNKLIKQSTDGFSYDGIDRLDLKKPTLFMSNHRDIVLDVALINLALHQNGADTVEAAVGDNLLHKPWVADLMRINKSFIVKRSEKTKRAMLAASKQLSAYIHHVLVDNQQHLWIAQREGRAKDGLDKTNAALISMLLLNKPKEMPIAEYLDTLNIVPVSISYEYDPCDTDKAKELAQREVSGDYVKEEGEDFKSITQGMAGYKGKVHLAFGTPIRGDFADSKAIAKAIDEQIIGQYKLYESNLSAHEKLANKSQTLVPHLQDRMQALTPEQKKWLLTMYANPVAAKKALSES